MLFKYYFVLINKYYLYRMSTGRSQANALMARIKKARKRKGYSQYQLAQKLELSQNAYSKLELGRSNLTLDKLFDIADILETNVADFFEDQPTTQEPKLRKARRS